LFFAIILNFGRSFPALFKQSGAFPLTGLPSRPPSPFPSDEFWMTCSFLSFVCHRHVVHLLRLTSSSEETTLRSEAVWASLGCDSPSSSPCYTPRYRCTVFCFLLRRGGFHSFLRIPPLRQCCLVRDDFLKLFGADGRRPALV